MKCPYCSSEMKSGYLQSSRGMLWDTVKIKGACLTPEPGSIVLGRAVPPLFGFIAVESSYCETCGILITPVKEL